MSVILDTGIVYAYYDRSDDWHTRARTVLTRRTGTLILPSAVIPEVDHLLGTRLGADSRTVFYRAIAEGHYYVADLLRAGYPRVLAINQQVDDLDLGFVDATIVAPAGSLNVSRIATTDRRHFPRLAQAFHLELIP